MRGGIKAQNGKGVGAMRHGAGGTWQADRVWKARKGDVSGHYG